MSSSAQIVAVGNVNAIEAMREGSEAARLRERVSVLENTLRLALDYGDHDADCPKFGVVDHVQDACDCWQADARRVLEKE
jgi:hypothetical protein